MPREKDLKRLVRERMRKTGEAYSTARRQLVAKRERARTTRAGARAPARAGRDLARLAGTRDAAVRARTGRTWAEWTAVLDAVRAMERSHTEIARYLHEECGVPHWWSQTVAVGYERIRGLRAKGQGRDGRFEVNKSKTVPVSLARLWRAFGPRARSKWLGTTRLTEKKATKEKTRRLLFEDGTPVEAYFLARGPAKSQVVIQHRRLATRADAERLRSFWGARLEALARGLGR